jgi:hypothetical protein
MPGPAADMARQLAQQAEAVCRRYLSNGFRAGRYWQVGDIANTPGQSLYVRLAGPSAGKWTDAATGEHGDLLDLIALNQNLPLRTRWRRRASSWPCRSHSSMSFRATARAVPLRLRDDCSRWRDRSPAPSLRRTCGSVGSQVFAASGRCASIPTATTPPTMQRPATAALR